MDDGRQEVIGRIDPVAELAQGVDQGGLGTLMHPRDAAEAIDAFAEADHGEEKAGGGAGVLDEELEGLDITLHGEEAYSLAEGAGARAFIEPDTDASEEGRPLVEAKA